MIATSVYHPPQKVALDPHKNLPDPYFGFSPDELEQEYMRYAMQVIDTLDCSSLPEHIRKSDAEFYRQEMDHIEGRIRRYRRDARLKYAWPDRSRYESLVTIAQDMKTRYPLERFIQDHVLQCRLEQKGDTWLGNCPIPTHDDNRPSFRVYDSIRFHCYGCGKRGDILELIGLVYGIESFSDRIEYLAEVIS